MRALSATLPKVTKAVLEKGGRDYAALIAEWKLIVGDALAESSLPEKLARKRPATEGNANPASGVLTVRVTSGAAMEFQHREPQILERINAYLGHRAVDRLKLIHGAIPGHRPRGARPLPVLTPTELQTIDSTVAPVADPELRERLVRLGRALGAGRVRRSAPEE